MNLRKTLLDSFSFGFIAATVLAVFIPRSQDEWVNHPWQAFAIAGVYLLGGAFLSLLLTRQRVRTWGEVLFGPVSVHEESSWYHNFWIWQLFLTLGTALVVASIKVEFSIFEMINEDGFTGALRLFSGLLDPNWTLFPRAVMNMIETIFMAFLATALALPFAFVLSFLAAKNVMQGKVGSSIYLVLRTFLNIVRSIEAMIWAVIFSVWVGIGPFAGMLALMIHSIASLAKQYSEMVESVDEGPLEAIQSTGANKFQTIWFGIVPQVLLPYISFTVYRWDINVRMATVIGLVGGGGIGTMLIQYQGQAMWREVGCIIFVIALVVWLLDWASAQIREALK